METVAKYKYARESAQKVRLVANQIRRKPVERALELLSFSPKKAARLVKKTLLSAVANAENNDHMDRDTLYVARIMVDEGSRMRRMRARAKGRGARIIKQFCHITIAVGEI